MSWLRLVIALLGLYFENLLYFGDGYVTDSFSSTVHDFVLLGASDPALSRARV